MGPSAANSPTDRDKTAAERAAEYIAASQTPNGSFFFSEYPPNGAAEALVSLSTVGRKDSSTQRALDFMRVNGPKDAVKEPAYAGRIAMALVAYGEDPQDFGGYDYIARIRASYDPNTGAYDPRRRIYANALSILGLASGGLQLPEKSIAFMRSNECPGGGFGHDPGCPTGADTDTTAMAVSSLLATGTSQKDGMIERAFLFLKLVQNTDGGFGLSIGTPSNANSTGLALSMFAAAGIDQVSWAKGKGREPKTALLALQGLDGGFKYRSDSTASNDYATVQALPGIMGFIYPPRITLKSDTDQREISGRSSDSRRGGALTRVDLKPSLAPSTHAQEDFGTSTSAVVVISFPGVEAQTYCPKITIGARGLDALRATGLPLITRGFGPTLGEAVCKIRDSGNPYEDCLSSSGHWHYWHLVEGAWVESNLGPSNFVLGQDSVEGWSWSKGAVLNPPDKDFAHPSKCSAPTDGMAVPSIRKSAPDPMTRLPALALVLVAMSLTAWKVRSRVDNET